MIKIIGTSKTNRIMNYSARVHTCRRIGFEKPPIVFRSGFGQNQINEKRKMESGKWKEVI
jgi:hypothetical protein